MSHKQNDRYYEAVAEYEAEKVEKDLEDDDSGDPDEFSHSERGYESQLERDHGYN